MKPFYLLLIVSISMWSTSFATIVDEQKEVEARVVKALGHADYARLLKLSPSEKEVFDDMAIDLLDGQMTLVEFVSTLHHIAPSAHAVLLPIAKRRPVHPNEKLEMGIVEFLEMVAKELGISDKVKNAGNPKLKGTKDQKKIELMKKVKTIEPLSTTEFIDIIATNLKLEKEERDVLGDMIADLVDGHMSAEEFLSVLSHTSPSTYAALTRVVNSITLDDFGKMLKLDKEDREVAETVMDMIHELVHEQMSLDEFLSILSHTAPSAHRHLTRIVTEFNGRVAGLKTKEGKEFVKKLTKALREVGKALFAEKDNEISKEERDKEVMVQLINTIRDYGAIARDSEKANEEIREAFPDVLAIAQAAAINLSQVGGYL